MLAITLVLVAYGLISRKIEGSILTGPTLFTVFGLVAGPAALGLIPLQMGNEALHLLVEVTLILVLFSDAANIDLDVPPPAVPLAMLDLKPLAVPGAEAF